MTSARAYRRVLIGLAAAVVLFAAGTSLAGVAFFPGKLEGGKFIADSSAKKPVYAIPFGQIACTVEGGVARTKFQQTFAGPENAVTGVCLVALPPGVTEQGLSMTTNPPEGTPAAVKNLRFLAPPEAQKVLEAIAAGADAPPLLALSGRPVAVVESLELKGKLEIAVTFEQKPRSVQGITMIDCPMPMTKFANGQTRVSLSASVKADKPLRGLFSPSHDAAIERKGLFEARAVVKAENWRGGDDFRLCYVADDDALGLRALAYRAEGDADGYFMIVGNPTGDPKGDKPIDKDVTFVLDTSGSMRGEKIEQARAAIDYCLTHLNPGDRFNMITFGTTVRTFREALAPNQPEHIKAARQFVDETVAQGNTNIGEALSQALAGSAEPGRLRIMIFLTDGTPTAGEVSPDRIIAQCAKSNKADTHIFVVGLGQDVNAHLLDKLAEMSDGASEYIVDDEEIDVKVASLYDRLSNPVLASVAVDFGDLRTHSFYPRKLPALFRGGEVMIFGRYRDGGTHTVKLTGELAGRKITYECRAEFPAALNGREAEFVAPLWAARKIGFLLQEIRLHKDNKEMIEDVIALSKRFGIVTEYTEFLAYGNTTAPAGAVFEEAHRRMAAAKAQQSGAWAVNQAFNERQMQQRIVAGDQANSFRDRRGQVVNTQAIRQVGNKTYYLREGQWSDAEEAGKRASRSVKLYSPEYFELVKKNADFAKAQSLGWAVSMNVGEERIVVEKDGKTQDEQLKTLAAPEPQQQNDLQNNDQQQRFNQQIPNNNVNQLRNLRQQGIPQQAIPQKQEERQQKQQQD